MLPPYVSASVSKYKQFFSQGKHPNPVQTSAKKAQIQRGKHLQQDNDPKHCFKFTMDYVKNSKLNVLAYTSQRKYNLLSYPTGRV